MLVRDLGGVGRGGAGLGGGRRMDEGRGWGGGRGRSGVFGRVAATSGAVFVVAGYPVASRFGAIF